MGLDVDVHLLHGFKIPLSIAFDSELINRCIVDGDDYQLIHDPESRDELIDTHVISRALKKILNTKRWNIYILTSSQDKCNPETSYFYLFDNRQTLFCGNAYSSPDYATGKIEIPSPQDETVISLDKVPLTDGEWEYNVHWIVESSW